MYNAVHGVDGELLYGVADMAIFDELSWDSVMRGNAALLSNAKLVVCDGNLPVKVGDAPLVRKGTRCCRSTTWR
jgi:hypothetical protein